MIINDRQRLTAIKQLSKNKESIKALREHLSIYPDTVGITKRLRNIEIEILIAIKEIKENGGKMKE